MHTYIHAQRVAPYSLVYAYTHIYIVLYVPYLGTYRYLGIWNTNMQLNITVYMYLSLVSIVKMVI